MICRCVILLRIGLCDRGTVRRFVGGRSTVATENTLRAISDAKRHRLAWE